MHQKIISANIAEMFLQAAKEWNSQPAFAARHHKEEKFQTVSYSAWCERSLALAAGLIELGVEAREHVGIFSDNSLSWIVADAAIQFCGAADVPRGSDIMSAEVLYILNHADIKILFLEKRALLDKIKAVSEKLLYLSHIIVMEESEDFPETTLQGHFRLLSLASLERQGRQLRVSGDRRVEERVRQISPNDLFTLIYTSGTTGIPKGVQLTHKAICSQIKNLPLAFSKKERALSILPIWHSYERVFEMVVISQGGCTYYSSLRHLSADFQLVKPTIMASAPRLWEALYERIIATATKQSFVKKLLFHQALASLKAVKKAERFFKKQQVDLVGRSLFASIGLAILHLMKWVVAILPSLLLDKLIIVKLRSVLGGKLRATISGGGALPSHIDEFFNDIGMLVLEGYGLTESSPVLAVRTQEKLILGTVGPPIPETEIRIISLNDGKILYPDESRSDLGSGRSGEICARGPQIMKGYYKDHETTAKILRDGWLSTGDIGLITFNGCLKIIGRCKETIVLLSGENVEPLPIESRLLESPLIDQCMVVGQDQKQLGVLIVPSLRGLAEAGVKMTSLAELLKYQEKMKPLFQEEIRRRVSSEHGFKTFEKIACWRLLEKPFEVGKELTSTYKLKRHVIAESYEILLKQMFEG